MGGFERSARALITIFKWRRSLTGRSVDSGDKSPYSIARALVRRSDVRDRLVDPVWSSDMLVRPRDLADQMSGDQQELFTLPLESARCKAREIIDQAPRGGLRPTIEKWRQLPDGQIEFAIRHFPAGD
jgi:hypothetical protein